MNMITATVRYNDNCADIDFPCLDIYLYSKLMELHADDPNNTTLFVSEIVEPEELSCLKDQVLWRMMIDNPHINTVYLCRDNDEAGQKANKRTSDALFVKGIQHEILIPNRKDWNEDLLYPTELEETECISQQIL